MSELLKINVNDKIEKKNGLSYLSWAWAWGEVLKIDPQATWNATGVNGLPAAFLPDGSAMVGVAVTIKGHAKSCLLPVMDHRNKAIKNPDAFAINTAIMRCLAKAIAMHGLGLYIYAGEDLPEGEEEKKPPSGSARDHLREVFESLQPEIQQGIRKTAEHMSAKEPGEALAVFDLAADQWDVDKADLKKAVWYLLDSKTRSAIKAHEAAQ